MSWWLYWRVGRSLRWTTSVETWFRWVNMQMYFSFHYCSYCVPISWWLCWRAVLWRITVEIVLGEWVNLQIDFSFHYTIAIVSRCPDGFTDGLGALCGGEPAWRLVLGEWTCKSIPLFITVAIVSRFPDGFADGLCGGESPWRFVLREWVNMQIYFSFQYCSYCVPMSWWLYWRVVRSVRWRTSVETCSRWVNMQMYFSFHYCSYRVPISWWLCWRAVWWRTTEEICSRWVSEHANVFLYSLL